MVDLPIDGLTPAPPFSFVGLDIFGPWLVSARRKRGGMTNNKRWAVLFTCLTTRAIHIEVIESMDASCFINALRRFLALRGPAVQFRSDCGTVEPRLSGPRLSGLFDYPDFFSGPVFFS